MRDAGPEALCGDVMDVGSTCDRLPAPPRPEGM